VPQPSDNKKILKKTIGKQKISSEPNPAIKGKGGKLNEDLVIPPQVGKWLTENDTQVLSNLTRGLKVAEKDKDKAKRNLHTARKLCIKKMIAYCYTDAEICLELEINGSQLHQYKRVLFRDEIEAMKKSTPEEQFVQYRHIQMEIVKDIDVLIEKYKETNHANALNNALKTKSDILRDIAVKAQDMGFMEKKAGELKVTHNVDLSQLNDQQLLDLLIRQHALVQKLAKGKVVPLKEIKRSMKIESASKPE